MMEVKHQCTAEGRNMVTQVTKVTWRHAGSNRVQPLVKMIGFGQAQLPAAQLGHLFWVRDDQEIQT